MAKFLVRGETTLQWELNVEAEDYLEAEAKAKESVADFDHPIEGEITGQQDRILRCIEVG